MDMSETGALLHRAGGQIQILQATPEQLSQLRQTHQIQILHADQFMVSKNQWTTGITHADI